MHPTSERTRPAGSDNLILFDRPAMHRTSFPVLPLSRDDLAAIHAIDEARAPTVELDLAIDIAVESIRATPFVTILSDSSALLESPRDLTDSDLLSAQDDLQHAFPGARVTLTWCRTRTHRSAFVLVIDGASVPDDHAA